MVAGCKSPAFFLFFLLFFFVNNKILTIFVVRLILSVSNFLGRLNGW